MPDSGLEVQLPSWPFP